MTDLEVLSIATPGELRADLLVIGCFEDEPPPLEGLSVSVVEAVERLTSRPGWKGQEEQYLETAPTGGAVASVALQGLGPRAELESRCTARWITQAVERARKGGVDHLALRLPPADATLGPAAAERIARRAGLAQYRFDRFLTDRRRHRHRLRRVTLVPPDGGAEDYRAAAAEVGPVVAAVSWTRDVANTPGNEANPEWMQERARELADSRGMTFRVLDRAELAERGMGGLLAVGAGSSSEPRLLRLEWGRGDLTLALVGKGITFDTGGISIKPSAEMDEMKYDKAGACTVLGIARAVADLELPVRLRVYVPLAENMPDGSAYRPGDIVRCYDGKTVEILNTDAEGRLILADALAWAAEEKPDALLEYSTLTGASVVALGLDGAALYCPHQQMAEDLLAAARDSGERLWRMPLWPEFVKQMKGTHADLKNSGGRWGGANTAAAFLSQFVGDLERWAHLDIAGGAAVGRDRDEPPGATGYGVALTLNWLRRCFLADAETGAR